MVNLIRCKSEVHLSDTIEIFIIIAYLNCIRIVSLNIKEFRFLCFTSRVPIIIMRKDIPSESIPSITEKSFWKFYGWKPNFTLSHYLFINLKIYFVIYNLQSGLFFLNISINLILIRTGWVINIRCIYQWSMTPVYFNYQIFMIKKQHLAISCSFQHDFWIIHTIQVAFLVLLKEHSFKFSFIHKLFCTLIQWIVFTCSIHGCQ